MAAVVLKNEDGKYLINKRSEKGLLANLWEFPNCEVDSFGSQRKQLEDFLQEEFNVEADIENGLLTKIQHIFSHLVWDVDVYAGITKSIGEIPDGLRVVDEEELNKFAFPVSHQKIWKSYKKINCLEK